MRETHQSFFEVLRFTHPACPKHAIRRLLAAGYLAVLTAVFAMGSNCPAASTADTIRNVQPMVVKIYGAGGLRGMEPYQSGILISPAGHILTVFSYVLDTDSITATLSDGRKFEARLVGADPRLELAVLKIEGSNLPCFDLHKTVDVDAPAQVLAFSNLFGVATGNEPVSVQHGVISVKTRLDARRGVFETAYHGPVYVLDAVTNNPGAAGGALVTWNGDLVGMLGKELRNAENNTWLNYAVPVAELREPVDNILAGKHAVSEDEPPEDKPARSWDLALLGVVLVPDVVEWTPPYVDYVRPDTPAARAGLRPDDLVVLVGDRLVRSSKALKTALEHADRDAPVKLTVLRGRELVEYVMEAKEP